jgi:hypothetical protein
MKNIFIELTEQNDSKILLNVMHIAWIEPNKEGSKIVSNMEHYSLPVKVKESYEQVKGLIASLDIH